MITLLDPEHQKLISKCVSDQQVKILMNRERTAEQEEEFKQLAALTEVLRDSRGLYTNDGAL